MIKNQSAAIANMNRNEGSLPALVFAAFIFMILIPTLLVLAGTFLDHVFGLTSFMAEQFALRAAVSIILFAVGGSLAVLSNTYLIKRGKGYAWGDASPSAQTKVLVTTGQVHKKPHDPRLHYASQFRWNLGRISVRRRHYSFRIVGSHIRMDKDR